jgi:hypothetical protein
LPAWITLQKVLAYSLKLSLYGRKRNGAWRNGPRKNILRKFHGVLNEEDGNIVSNNIPVTLLGVELASKTSDIANCVCGATATKNGRKSQEDGCLARCVSEYAG